MPTSCPAQKPEHKPGLEEEPRLSWTVVRLGPWGEPWGARATGSAAQVFRSGALGTQTHACPISWGRAAPARTAPAQFGLE